jgi:hypothetical protein
MKHTNNAKNMMHVPAVLICASIALFFQMIKNLLEDLEQQNLEIAQIYI